MSTPYHSQYWATALTLQGPGGTLESLSRSIANARVDLNPHQVDAALFAIRSPFSKGVMLADEVGLGKTIEAGIVITQRWAERRRKILLILPATLRKQWQQELMDKFSIPALILESKTYNQSRRAGHESPFLPKDSIVLCSYHFAAAKADEVKRVPWDLIVIDEAHRLRNVYKPSSKIAQSISDACAHAPKLLLTATPLQNSLQELYGLVSIIDPQVFGDLHSFREQFLKATDEQYRNLSLKDRLKPICTRTLRKQVLEYIRFTQRVPLTQDFLPTDDEQALYEMVTAYLQRDVLFALPASQRTLLTLVLRKLLASSTFAIAGTLRTLVQRLEAMDTAKEPVEADDFETMDEIAEEWNSGEAGEPEDLKPSPDLILKEMDELKRYLALADGIKTNSKGDALLSVIGTAFSKAESLGAARKAVIFTESRRTQGYLFDLLTQAGYADQIVMINGSNSDPHSKAVYERWQKRHAGTDAISGSRSADMKAALVEEFRDTATLLIATESAAEGVNLQFCSLVINYDLPWNPQRIEQRIGRCHRYGQKHDVVVVNFLNRRNAADQRVFQLLSQKFRLFDGVFGSSDEVLGALESGVDLEKRIAKVYQECRTAEDIQSAFDRLQAELDAQIEVRMADTRRSLLENFDEDVHARLRVHKEHAQDVLSERQHWLLGLTRNEFGNDVQADGHDGRFTYSGSLAPHGVYTLDWRQAEKGNENFYRPDHPLAQAAIESAISRRLDPAHLRLDYRKYGKLISALEPFLGKSGWLEASKLTVQSLETEEFVILCAADDHGNVLDPELCQKLLSLPAAVDGTPPDGLAAASMETIRAARLQENLQRVSERNGKHFDEEVAKLDNWAEDLKFGLEREIKELDKNIREARKQSAIAISLQDKLEAQKAMKGFEATRSRKRRELFESQDKIDQQRDDLITRIEKQMQHSHSVKPLFTVRWTLAG
jgi:adenine-specific DNA-methyltransferase